MKSWDSDLHVVKYKMKNWIEFHMLNFFLKSSHRRQRYACFNQPFVARCATGQPQLQRLFDGFV